MNPLGSRQHRRGNDKATALRVAVPPVLDTDRFRPLAGATLLRCMGETMGTSWSVVAAVELGSDKDCASIESLVTCACSDIIAQMSQWEPASELSRFNRADGGTWLRISPQFGQVLNMALAIAKASGGAFDPAVGRLSELWGFGASGSVTIGPQEAQRRAAAHYTWRDIQSDARRSRLFQPGGLRIDLSAIAKGFAVDYITARLEQSGIAHALIEIGGEIRAIGVKPDGQPWWVDIENAPHGCAQAVDRIALSGWAIATSGHYLRRCGSGERTWSHSLSLKSGMPVGDDLLSVSILHPGCMQADALATAIAVSGTDAGMAFANRHQLAARIETESGVAISIAWESYCREAQQKRTATA